MWCMEVIKPRSFSLFVKEGSRDLKLHGLIYRDLLLYSPDYGHGIQTHFIPCKLTWESTGLSDSCQWRKFTTWAGRGGGTNAS